MLIARVRATTARCGTCGQPSGRVHGRYRRQLRDVAVAGAGLVLQVHVRRFRCGNSGCRAVTFTEQVDGLTAPYARLTLGLRETLTQIGLERPSKCATTRCTSTRPPSAPRRSTAGWSSPASRCTNCAGPNRPSKPSSWS
ncbi:transposase family protein [Micromonospora sp. ATA32]|nr:transposase family protein [Micromonospora sp. ATA32]